MDSHGVGRRSLVAGGGPIYRLPEAYSLPNDPPGTVLAKLLQMLAVPDGELRYAEARSRQLEATLMTSPTSEVDASLHPSSAFRHSLKKRP